MFTSIIRTITGTKFQVNPLTHIYIYNLVFWVWAKKPPPPPPVAGEITKCRRL